jgi:hypothetical protein
MSEQGERMGVSDSSGRTVLGPVAMVRMQKAGIKYKKPIGFLRACKGFQRRSIRFGGVVDGQGGGQTLEQ